MTEETTCPLCGEKLKPIPEFYELFCDNPKCVLQGYDENNLKKAIPQIVRIRQEAKDEAYKEYAYQHGDCLLNLPDAELQKIRQVAKQEVFDELLEFTVKSDLPVDSKVIIRNYLEKRWLK